MIPASTIMPLLTFFVRWALTQEGVLAVALLGSYARDEARSDSDVDLLVLTSEPERFQSQTAWVDELPWEQGGCRSAPGRTKTTARSGRAASS